MNPLHELDPGPIDRAVEAFKGDRDPDVRALCELGRVWIADWEFRDRRDGYLPDMEKVGFAFTLASIGASNEAEDAYLQEAATFAETHLAGAMPAIRRAIARKTKRAARAATPPATGGESCP